MRIEHGGEDAEAASLAEPSTHLSAARDAMPPARVPVRTGRGLVAPNPFEAPAVAGAEADRVAQLHSHRMHAGCCG
jgi:hypothetical protein